MTEGEAFRRVWEMQEEIFASQARVAEMQLRILAGYRSLTDDELAELAELVAGREQR